MKACPTRTFVAAIALAAVVPVGVTTAAKAAFPSGETVREWNRIAEDIVVGTQWEPGVPASPRVFQSEGSIYMAYVSAAMYDAAVAIAGGYNSYGPPIAAPDGASPDAAVIQAAYVTLSEYFGMQRQADLDALRSQWLEGIPDGPEKEDGIAVGSAAAQQIVSLRTGDGRQTPFSVTSGFATKDPGPGVWRLTPAAYAVPQTPWVADVRPFVLRSTDQFLPEPPPSLEGEEWAEAFEQIKRFGDSAGSYRTEDQTNVARFWSANVIRQYNLAARDLSTARSLDLLETARLGAMVNVIGADSLIACLDAKYHYLFWRPMTAIDPSSVEPYPGDGFGPAPGFQDGNPGTVEQPGWRPFLTTPNHPEYPAAHGCVTSAMAEVFTELLGTKEIALTIHGTDLAGPLHAVETYETAKGLRAEIIDARLWAGLHYRFSNVAGVVLGRQVAKYDLRHAFRPI